MAFTRCCRLLTIYSRLSDVAAKQANAARYVTFDMQECSHDFLYVPSSVTPAVLECRLTRETTLLKEFRSFLVYLLQANLVSGRLERAGRHLGLSVLPSCAAVSSTSTLGVQVVVGTCGSTCMPSRHDDSHYCPYAKMSLARPAKETTQTSSKFGWSLETQ